MRPIPSHLLALLLLAAALAAACGGENAVDDAFQEDDASVTRDTHTVPVDLARHDGRTQVKAQVKGLTVWMDPLVTMREQGVENGRRWVMTGRVSKNLSYIHTFVPDDAFGAAKTVSARKFEVALDEHELNSMLSGLPLFVSLGVGGTTNYTAMVSLRPRFWRFTGSRAIRIDAPLRPVLAHDELVYRAVVRAANHSDLGVSTDDDVQVLIGSPEKSVWTVDFAYPQLALAADYVKDPVHFAVLGPVGATWVSKDASLELLVSSIGLTTQDPYETWPSTTCTPAVRQCLQTIRNADLSSCGDYRPVMACRHADPVTPAEPVTPERFATDLKAFLGSWYENHGADAIASGGRTLANARRAVRASKVTEVTDPEEDPNANDPSTTIVLRHPDVVWPGSDIVWFGSYDRATGKLREVYEFN